MENTIPEEYTQGYADFVKGQPKTGVDIEIIAADITGATVYKGVWTFTELFIEKQNEVDRKAAIWKALKEFINKAPEYAFYPTTSVVEDPPHYLNAD